MNALCVYLGSNPGAHPAYELATRDLARELARREITVVFGGSGVGLMGALADAALEAGGKVVGVIPRLLMEKEMGHTGLTEMHVVESMHERKRRMAELADGFIALPGGMGTLDEFFEALTWNQLGYHAKPCGLLDVNGFYTTLSAHLDLMVREGFVVREHREMILMADTPTGLLDMFATYQPPTVEKWIKRKKNL